MITDSDCSRGISGSAHWHNAGGKNGLQRGGKCVSFLLIYPNNGSRAWLTLNICKFPSTHSSVNNFSAENSKACIFAFGSNCPFRLKYWGVCWDATHFRSTDTSIKLENGKLFYSILFVVWEPCPCPWNLQMNNINHTVISSAFTALLCWRILGYYINHLMLNPIGTHPTLITVSENSIHELSVVTSGHKAFFSSKV